MTAARSRADWMQWVDRAFWPGGLALLAVAYGPLLFHWVRGWLTKSISIEHEYFSYGLIGLPFAAYIAWEKRSRWAALPEQSHPIGWGLLGLSAALYLSGVADWVNVSFPIALVGLCGLRKGVAGWRLMAAPLIFTALATPNEIPYLIAPYVVGLQRFIAAVSGFLLDQIGLDAQVEGIYLYVRDRAVEVAPHCAGLKMLLTCWYVGLMLIYWSGTVRAKSPLVLFLVGTTAISVAMNIVRNTILAYLHGTGQDGMFDFMHEGTGGDLYSAVMLMAVVLWFRAIERFHLAQVADLDRETQG
ncbi:MAG TPA: cyanoexosortase B [Coleofasciculaceae cyanobacterium]